MKKILLFALVVFSTQAISAGGRCEKQSGTLILGSGGITGMYYPTAGAIAAFVNRSDSGLRVAVVPSARASGENVAGLLSGAFDIGLVQSDVQYEAFTGSGTYEASGTDLRVLFSTFTESFTVVVQTDSGIKTFRDLSGKRISPGTTGSLYRSFMKEYAWQDDSLVVSNEFRGRELPAVRQRNLDASFYGYGHPYSVLADGMQDGGLTIISVDEKEKAAFLQKNPFFISAIIPANTYEGQNQSVSTFGPKATVLATTKLSDEAAYTIVKAIVENFDDFTKAHPAFTGLTKDELLIGNTAPFHNGALRYYREVGLIK